MNTVAQKLLKKKVIEKPTKVIETRLTNQGCENPAINPQTVNERLEGLDAVFAVIPKASFDFALIGSEDSLVT